MPHVIDEHRKLVTVVHISDIRSFTGVWRGVYYECRAVPDTSSMVIGSVVYCHVMPGSTQLIHNVPTLPVTGFKPIIIWSGAIVDIPVGWYLCDGNNGTPNLLDKFIMGATAAYDVGTTGGSVSFNLEHSHTILDYAYTRTDYETQPLGVRHSHPSVLGKYNTSSTSGIKVAQWFSFIGYTDNGIEHTHVVDEFPQPASTDHLHKVYGTTGLALTTVDLLPKYYAKAYIMASTPYDIPIGSICFSVEDPSTYPLGYVVSGNDDYSASPWLGWTYVWGAGDFPLIAGEFLDGDSVGQHIHYLPPETTNIGSEHRHLMPAGSFSSGTASNLSPFGGGHYGSWIIDPHSHGIVIPNPAYIEEGGLHVHPLTASQLEMHGSLNVVDPPHIMLYYVYRAY